MRAIRVSLVPVIVALAASLNAQAPSLLLGRKISAKFGGFGSGLQERDFWGQSIAWLGDLDGDGHGDLAVGAFGDDDGALDAGSLWILFLDGRGAVRAKQKIGHFEGGLSAVPSIWAFFGISLAFLGDLDHDGRPELAVGSEEDDGGSAAGSVYVLSLNPNGTVASQRKISAIAGNFSGELEAGDSFGRALARVGDLDGDGLPELAVGAIGDDDGGDGIGGRGAIWILFLNADGSVREHQKISSTVGGFDGSSSVFSYFGGALAPLGDLDGDGVPDLAAGDQYYTEVGYATGAVYVLFLNADGTVKAQQNISPGSGGFTGVLGDVDLFGASVANVGDCDGDGVVDLAVGAPQDDGGGYGAGAVWLLFLKTDGTVHDAQRISAKRARGGDWTQEDNFGSGVAGLGDLDGDGRLELAVGAVGDDDGGQSYFSDVGAVWLLFLDTAVTIDFERENDALAALENGRALSPDPGFGARLQVKGLSASGLSAAVFDSTRGGPNDPGSDPGLLVGRGNVLILQGTPGESVPGVYDHPHADSGGGRLTLELGGEAVAPRSIDLVDLGSGSAVLTLFDPLGRTRTFLVPAGWTRDVAVHGPPGFGRLDLTVLTPQPGFAASATATETRGFDPMRVVGMTVELSGPGALDTLVYRRPRAPVPVQASR